MTIKLAYVTERDGLVFLCDKEGKELPFQVVPVDAIAQFIKPRFGFFHGNGAFEELPYEGWESRCIKENLDPRWVGGTSAVQDMQAMLSAAKVDVSEALVKVPDRKPESRDYYNCNDEWNACLDELEGK